MTRIYSNPPLKNTNSMLATRPNNLSLVCLYLSLYISFLSFGHPPYFFISFDTETESTTIQKQQKAYNLHALEILGPLKFRAMQTPTGPLTKDHSSTPALHRIPKHSLRLPYIHFHFSSLHLQYKTNGIHPQIPQPIRLTLTPQWYDRQLGPRTTRTVENIIK